MTLQKKGKPSWAPARMLDVKGVPNGIVPRWVNKDPANVEKKTAEGWKPINATTLQIVEHGASDSLSTAKTYRDVVLMGLPKETAEARREFFQEQTNRQTIGLKKELQDKVDGAAKGSQAAPVHGTIVIS